MRKIETAKCMTPRDAQTINFAAMVQKGQGRKGTATPCILHPVDEYLLAQHQPGMTAGALYTSYTTFGDDPFILSVHVEPVKFSAWDYARERSTHTCSSANV